VKDSDVGIRSDNADTYPGLGLIRIRTGEALTIGNPGTFVDIQVNNSAITLVDVLSITRGVTASARAAGSSLTGLM
jgi:hypothetical protein